MGKGPGGKGRLRTSEGELTMQRERSLHSKHGGVHFTQIGQAEEINNFVKSLPDEKRDSLFEVMQELHNQGLIRIENDEEWMDPSGEQHPD